MRVTLFRGQIGYWFHTKLALKRFFFVKELDIIIRESRSARHKDSFVSNLLCSGLRCQRHTFIYSGKRLRLMMNDYSETSGTLDDIKQANPQNDQYKERLCRSAGTSTAHYRLQVVIKWREKCLVGNRAAYGERDRKKGTDGFGDTTRNMKDRQYDLSIAIEM